jgi:hypothetical protein
MALLFLALGAFAGFEVGRWWVAVIPPAVGVVTAFVVVWMGGAVGDTPLPFLALALAAAAALGSLTRRRVGPSRAR